jgi:hypothetical protein
MRFTKVLISSAVVAAAFTGTTANAAGPTLTDVLGNSGITVGGAFDVSYDWAANDSVEGRVFDIENDGFSFHQANLSASKAFSGGIGATVNVLAGDDAQITSGGDDEFDVLQGFVSYTNGGLSVMGGRFVTLAGMEVINPAGNLNASRSLLFFTQPLLHEGVRASYKINDMLSVTLGLVNQTFAVSETDENNTDTSLEAQIALTPMKNLSVFLTGYTGNEDFGDGGGEGNGADIRTDLLDLVVNLNVTESLYVGLNADYIGMEDGSGGHDELHGVAGYVGLKFMPKWRVAARSEYLSIDAFDGGDTYFRTNTLTLAHACTENLEILLEGRHDRISGSRFFSEQFAPIDEGSENDQYTGTLKAILRF